MSVDSKRRTPDPPEERCKAWKLQDRPSWDSYKSRPPGALECVLSPGHVGDHRSELYFYSASNEREFLMHVLDTCDPASDCAIGNDEIDKARNIVERIYRSYGPDDASEPIDELASFESVPRIWEGKDLALDLEFVQAVHKLDAPVPRLTVFFSATTGYDVYGVEEIASFMQTWKAYRGC